MPGADDYGGFQMMSLDLAKLNGESWYLVFFILMDMDLTFTGS